MIKHVIAIGLTAILLASCASMKKAAAPQPVKEKAAAGAFDESFDPLSLKDDDIVISGKNEQPAPKQEYSSGVPMSSTSKVSTDEMQETDGFRVQLFATRSIETATVGQQKAEQLFGAQHQKIYLIFETPFYKLRVGDLLSRKAAEQLRDTAKTYGYDQAFIVRSKVQVTKEQMDNNY